MVCRCAGIHPAWRTGLVQTAQVLDLEQDARRKPRVALVVRNLERDGSVAAEQVALHRDRAAVEAHRERHPTSLGERTTCVCTKDRERAGIVLECGPLFAFPAMRFEFEELVEPSVEVALRIEVIVDERAGLAEPAFLPAQLFTLLARERV